MRQRLDPIARGVVSSSTAISAPARRYCAARARGAARPGQGGPAVATRAEDFSRIWAAPQVMTPGSVQPGIGTGRSSAPVARIHGALQQARAAAHRDADLALARDAPDRGARTYCAPLCRKARRARRHASNRAEQALATRVSVMAR